MAGVVKRPSGNLPASGRTKGNTDAQRLASALLSWATKLNFISYTQDKNLDGVSSQFVPSGLCKLSIFLRPEIPQVGMDPKEYQGQGCQEARSVCSSSTAYSGFRPNLQHQLYYLCQGPEDCGSGRLLLSAPLKHVRSLLVGSLYFY